MAQDPYKYFRVEARELLDQLGKGVMDLEKGAVAADLAPRLLRLAHTLKGAARVVKQREIAEEAHAIEDALAPFRESAARASRGDIEGVLNLLDKISTRVASLTPGNAAMPTAEKPLPEEALRTVRTDIGEMDALLNGIAEAHARMGSIRKSLGLLERIRYLVDSLVEHIVSSQEATIGARMGSLKKNRVRSIAEELRTTLDGLRMNWASSLDHMDQELRRVRDSAEQLRLVPAGALFTSLERTARDAAQAQGKKVVFEGRGADVRLDAHVLGTVQGALLQLVRNAVAHGIELERVRIDGGKPAEGRVTLEVLRRGQRVAFRCTDDGQGFDLEAVRRAAQRKGLPSSEMEELGAEQLVGLLLRGGISTSASINGVAGRGIGLDVVREAAARLNGELSVRTEAGRGTTVALLVPLTLASFTALVMESPGVVAAIPIDNVQNTFRVAPKEVVRSADGQSITWANQAIPFVQLTALFSRSERSSGNGRPCTAVVVRGADGLAAVGVDRLAGTSRVVLRPLPELAPAAPAVAGAFLDAEGSLQLVLDADGLVREAQRGSPPLPGPEAPRQTILVIDDSLTTRMLEQSILESAGYEVDLATSGEEALEKSRRKRYALFLVDVEMPGMDGFAFIEHARSDPTLRDVPSILVTSRSSLEDRRRGQDVGAQGYVAKSEFEQADLLERIRRLVG